MTEKLMASELRYRRLFETAKDGILILDAETGKIVDVNPFLIDLLGFTKQNFIEKSIWEIGAFQDIYENKEKFLELQQNEYVRYENLPIVTSDGRKIHVEFVSNVYLVNDKKVIQCHIREITERKSKENSLNETHRATSEFLNILLNHLHTPIIIWDTSMIIKRFNRKFELLSGYNSDEIIDRKIDFLFPKEKIAATLELLKNHPDDEQEVAEIDILTKDNTIKTVLWNSSRILDEEGKNIIATISQDITSRRKSELALRKSESHLRTLVKTIPDLIWLKDTNGVYLSCNPMFERFFGARETDIVGKTDYDFVDRELADFFRRNDRKAIEAGKPTSNEEWVTFADDGHRAFLDTIKTPIYDSDEKLLGVLGIGRDITERKKSEDALFESEIKYRAFFENSIDAILLTRPDGKIISANPAACIMFGYTENELINLGRSGIVDTSDPQLSLLLAERAEKGKVRGELTFIRKDGTKFPCEISSSIFKNRDGIEHTSMIIRDFSKRKRDEIELVKLSRAVEQSPTSVIVTDIKGNIEYINPKILEITGYTKEELIGKNPRIFSSGEKPKSEYEQLWNTISTGNEWFGEFHNKKKNGELYWESVSISPIINEKREIMNYVAIKEDITERKKFIEDLKIAKEKAEESDRLKSAFLANMSHEIRTPMNGILGFTNLLLEPDLSSEQKESFIEIVHQSGQRMLNTVNDIIEISKIEAGLTQLNLTATDVNERMEELFRFFQPEADKKGLILSVEMYLPKKNKNTLTDQNKLDSILTNLIKNAIKYTLDGEIKVGCKVKMNQLEFYVKDTGIGIPKNRHHAVFNRFEQADIKDTRAFEGSGLGLSIAKAYVEMLGGKIWVESNSDGYREAKGSAFFFTLPLSAKTQEKKTVNQDEKTSQIKELKIIIAEDDETSALYLQTILKKVSNKILLTKNGHETVKACRNNPDTDVILMDIQMPGLDGYETTLQIREFNKDVAIIAQTAFALSGDKEKAMEAGCTDYITKPINSKVLLHKIGKLKFN